jgi:tetratricopeptide (TPR) repeat protein
MPRVAPLLVVAFALAAPATARAQRPSNRELAIIHYERGRAHYAAGRYRQAVFELETAHSLDPSGTNLLLNLGTVHERLGNIDAAILSYERHLAATTDPEDRARTQRVLMRLRGARVELAEMSRRHGRADGVFWATTGASVTLLALGATMFLTAEQEADRTAPIAFTVSGGALGVLAAVLYFAREAPPRQTLFVGAGFAPGAATLGVAGSF